MLPKADFAGKGAITSVRPAPIRSWRTYELPKSEFEWGGETIDSLELAIPVDPGEVCVRVKLEVAGSYDGSLWAR